MYWVFRKRLGAYVIAAVFFVGWVLGLGHVALFDWDEVNFAECAREMRQTGEYLYAQIGFLPFWEKPPLFFWLQALSQSLWGETAFAARLPNAIISFLTLIVLYETGRVWHSHTFGLTWLFLYGISLLPGFYARSGLIDPLFNLFMLGALLSGASAFQSRDQRLPYATYGLLCGLATLTKGPVGLFLPSLALATLSLGKRRLSPLLKLSIIGGSVWIALVGGWVLALYLKGKSKLLADFWVYQWRLFSTPDAGHAGPWFYHLLVLGIGVFPASWWAFGARQLHRLPLGGQALLLMTAWTIIIFSVVRTKIIHYSSLAYYGIAYLAAWTWSERRYWINTRGWLLLGLGGFMFGLLTIAAGILMNQNYRWIGLIQDPFAQAVLRSEPIVWTGWEGWAGFVLISGLSLIFLRRMGSWKRLGLAGLVLIVWEALVLSAFAPRVEAYTQAPLRRFCEEKAAEGAIVWSLGFKSYIPYFYGKMRPDLSPRLTGSFESFQTLLLSGDLSWPVYFVSRVERYQTFVEKYNLEVIGRRGGYVFLKGGPYRPEAKRP
ncbi:MAG: glycosyltransferase family 39 protein [Bacteroidia bacterium]|nr:glycosyltransferase family 39 protein [Bacteroidia bacterium]